MLEVCFWCNELFDNHTNHWERHTQQRQQRQKGETMRTPQRGANFLAREAKELQDKQEYPWYARRLAGLMEAVEKSNGRVVRVKKDRMEKRDHMENLI